MSIDAKEFTKGNSLIVGKKIKDKNNEYEIDGVIVYDAYCISSGTPFLLQCPNIVFNLEEPVYICGHGDGKKQEISGYSMREIAILLKYNTNISQIKKIVIMSCHGKHKNHQGDNMASLLQKELSDLGIQINVESVAEHTTIVVDYLNKALVVDKKFNILLFGSMQRNLQRKLGCLHLSIGINNIECLLPNYLSKYGKDIAIHNYALISKGKDNKMDNFTRNCYILIWLSVLSSFISAFLYINNIKDNKLVISLLVVFVSLVLFFLYSGIFKDSILGICDNLKMMVKKYNNTSHHTGNNDDSKTI